MTLTSGIYLDYNASAPLKECALKAMMGVYSHPGNPSSIHSFGRAQRKYLDDARSIIVAALDAKSHILVFTSGGTEANNLALCGFKGDTVYVGATDHASCLNARKDRYFVPVNAQGLWDLEALTHMLEGRLTDVPALISFALANNETGVIQRAKDIVRVAKAFGALVHCDAAQAVGRIPVSFSDLGVDFMTLSAHKFGGPAGVGGLLIRKGLSVNPILSGGGQEYAWRAGTQNVMGCVGFASALKDAITQDWSAVQALRDTLEESLMQEDAVIHGRGAPHRLPNTSCLGMPGVLAQNQVMAFDVEGFSVSAGSACSSGKVADSHVLHAMGLEVHAPHAIRVSLSPTTTAEQITAFTQAWKKIYRRAIPSILEKRKSPPCL